MLFGQDTTFRRAAELSDSLGRDPSFRPTGEGAATETLDAALDSLFINRVDVIKIDVQGADMVAMHTRHEQ